MLKCSFSENYYNQQEFFIERGFNIHPMYNCKIDLNDRVHTFEALSELQRKIQNRFYKQLQNNQNSEFNYFDGEKERMANLLLNKSLSS